MVLEFENTSKVFRSSITKRYVYTLGPVSFGIREGEIFGYLGPNGAGKTTTIKVALGLLRPSSGTVSIFSKPSTSLDVRKRIGFLPEQPYFYPHLTGRELLEFYAEIFGLRPRVARARAEELLELTGIAEFGRTPISKYSKGMLQRVGMAQALINDPDLVILDEPLAGLDPVGRREIRDVILGLKGKGKTVFFSSHILQDVEMICDRVGILSQGKILQIATVADVLHESITFVEILLEGFSVEKAGRLGLTQAAPRGERTVITLPAGADVNSAVTSLIRAGAGIVAVTPQRQTLEDYFMSEIQGTRSPEGREEGAKRRDREKAGFKL